MILEAAESVLTHDSCFADILFTLLGKSMLGFIHRRGASTR